MATRHPYQLPPPDGVLTGSLPSDLLGFKLWKCRECGTRYRLNPIVRRWYVQPPTTS